ncbi:hypothetical protein KFE25_004601 [Diacronema lutheri]|uniref:Uncharacterized protein n=1 Tax=Diacronema lutheri TaxID=2081491 RepID=A0A8J5XNS8_DIALT|nr:hypothetical protein KFE25_004601 [Diacronema lutheri]
MRAGVLGALSAGGRIAGRLLQQAVLAGDSAPRVATAADDEKHEDLSINALLAIVFGALSVAIVVCTCALCVGMWMHSRKERVYEPSQPACSWASPRRTDASADMVVRESRAAAHGTSGKASARDALDARTVVYHLSDDELSAAGSHAAGALPTRVVLSLSHAPSAPASPALIPRPALDSAHAAGTPATPTEWAHSTGVPAAEAATPRAEGSDAPATQRARRHTSSAPPSRERAELDAGADERV